MYEPHDALPAALLAEKLDRAEEVIANIDHALRGDGRSSVLIVVAQGIITEYYEQYEA